jgi:hypothetical protein
MADVVRLTVVPSQVEAEVACGLLRSEGIFCDYRRASFLSAASWPAGGDWQEILVAEPDLLRAREIIAVIQGEDDT